MNPTIPESVIAPQELVRAPRPAAMKYFIAADILLTAIGFICGGMLTSEPIYLVLFLALNAIWLILYRLLWQGRNWTRIVFIVVCVFSVGGIFLMQEYSALQKFLTIANAAFSIVWCWWLLTPAVVAFTKGQPANVSK